MPKVNEFDNSYLNPGDEDDIIIGTGDRAVSLSKLRAKMIGDDVYTGIKDFREPTIFQGSKRRDLESDFGGLGAGGRWIKVARIQKDNPIGAGELAQFVGRAMIQSNYGNTGGAQYIAEFSFGSRGTIQPLLNEFGLGAHNGGASRVEWAIYRDADGWHYLYLFQPEYSGFGVIDYRPFACTEYWSVYNPTTDAGLTLVWSSLTGNRQTGKLGVEPWIAPTFQNGWLNYESLNWNDAGFFKDQFGIIHLRGLIKTGTLDAVAFTLPTGYRPTKANLFVTISNDGISNILSRLDILSTGGVVPRSGANNWFSLEGIQFRV
jgi:hypothetical protein